MRAGVGGNAQIGFSPVDVSLTALRVVTSPRTFLAKVCIQKVSTPRSSLLRPLEIQVVSVLFVMMTQVTVLVLVVHVIT